MKRKIIEFGVVLAVIYAGLIVYFQRSVEKTQWITDGWRLSSKEDPFLYPAFSILSLILVLGGVALGLWLAFRMLVSKHRRWWFGGFFGLLGTAGILIWAAVLPASERAGTVHVPVIGTGLIALGIVFLFAFKARR